MRYTVNEEKFENIYHYATKNLLFSFGNGILRIINKASGNAYIFLISKEHPRLQIYKDKEFLNGRWTIYKWLFFFFGRSNVLYLEAKEELAREYNMDRMNGLRLMQKFMREDYSFLNSLMIQQDNIDRNCHPAPELYKRDLCTFLQKYDYQINENLKIISIEGIPI